MKVIEENELDLDYHSFTFGTLHVGAFGYGTWKVIKNQEDLRSRDAPSGARRLRSFTTRRGSPASRTP